MKVACVLLDIRIGKNETWPAGTLFGFKLYGKNELNGKIIWTIENYDEILDLAEKDHKFVMKNFDKEKVTKTETNLIIRAFEASTR